MKSKEFIRQLQDLDPDGEMDVFFHFSKSMEYFNFIAEDVIAYDSNTPGVKEIIVLLDERLKPDDKNNTENTGRKG